MIKNSPNVDMDFQVLNSSMKSNYSYRREQFVPSAMYLKRITMYVISVLYYIQLTQTSMHVCAALKRAARKWDKQPSQDE